MLLPSSKTAKSTGRKLLDFVSSVNAGLRAVFIDPPRRRARPGVYLRHRSLAGVQSLEARAMLSITANDANYDASSAGTLNVAAPGLLADCSDSGGYQMSAYMMGGPSDGTASVNTNGSFSYTPDTNFTGTDTFEYYATDTNGDRSNIASVQLDVQMGVVTFVDTTKLP
ncbi:MAG TPA: Ig-like domain-containing protein, partial [Pirellulales bacterium]|nr:Ig-like domain-containing protein [Pirellulales bacterium]